MSPEFEEEIASSPSEVFEQHTVRIFTFVREKLLIQGIFSISISMNPNRDMHFAMN